MKHLAIFVATGFEDTELIAALDVFKRNDISYDLYSVENKLEVHGKFEAIVKTNQISSFYDDYKGLFLPGGPGHKLLLESEDLTNIIKYYKLHGKYLTAICAAPDVLINAGVIDEGTIITSHHDHAQIPTNTGNDVEVDGKFITGRDFKSTILFAETVAKTIK